MVREEVREDAIPRLIIRLALFQFPRFSNTSRRWRVVEIRHPRHAIAAGSPSPAAKDRRPGRDLGAESRELPQYGVPPLIEATELALERGGASEPRHVLLAAVVEWWRRLLMPRLREVLSLLLIIQTYNQ